jgi:hypothetical protein
MYYRLGNDHFGLTFVGSVYFGYGQKLYFGIRFHFSKFDILLSTLSGFKILRGVK